MKSRYTIAALVVLATLVVACQVEYPCYEGPDFIMFSEKSHNLGILSNEEWFEIPVSATRTADHDRLIGVEILSRESNAIEGRHYDIESSTLCIPAGKLTTAVRIRGYADNIEVSDSLGVALRLVVDKEMQSDLYTLDTEVLLHKCCPVDINAFVGYAKLTSTWVMQYMNAEARLVRTERNPENEWGIIVKDMFYDGYDVSLTLNTKERLEPTVEMEEHVIGTTGEAFGTIYGDGKLRMMTPMGYTSYFSSCENFLVNYSTMYVEAVGTVGLYVNILEWISDDEAERIMREGF